MASSNHSEIPPSTTEGDMVDRCSIESIEDRLALETERVAQRLSKEKRKLERKAAKKAQRAEDELRRQLLREAKETAEHDRQARLRQRELEDEEAYRLSARRERREKRLQMARQAVEVGEKMLNEARAEFEQDGKIMEKMAQRGLEKKKDRLERALASLARPLSSESDYFDEESEDNDDDEEERGEGNFMTKKKNDNTAIIESSCKRKNKGKMEKKKSDNGNGVENGATLAIENENFTTEIKNAVIRKLPTWPLGIRITQAQRHSLLPCAFISYIRPGCAASFNADVAVGDLIVAINRKSVVGWNFEDIFNLLDRASMRNKVRLSLLPQRLTVSFAVNRFDEPNLPLGVTVSNGEIVSVMAGSLGYLAGIRPGFILTEVNGVRMTGQSNEFVNKALAANQIEIKAAINGLV